jgi:hypothetical protein
MCPLGEVPEWIRGHIVRDVYGRRVLILTRHDLMEFDHDHELLMGVEKFILVSRPYVHEVWIEDWRFAPAIIKKAVRGLGRGAPVAFSRWQVSATDLSAVSEREWARIKAELGEIQP